MAPLVTCLVGLLEAAGWLLAASPVASLQPSLHLLFVAPLVTCLVGLLEAAGWLLVQMPPGSPAVVITTIIAPSLNPRPVTAGWLWVAAFGFLAAPRAAVWSNQSTDRNPSLDCHCILAVCDCILDTDQRPLTAR